MESAISRRKFVRAVSSLGSVMLVERFSVLAKVSTGDLSVLPPSTAAVQQDNPAGKKKPKILVFDVIQTMLDLNVLRPHFARAFGDDRALDDWFSLLLQYSLVVTVADAYADFGTLGRAVLEMLASTKGVQISSEEKTRILQGMLTLPAHPEVPESLKRLRSAGFRMVTLTNSSPVAIKAQLQNTGLTQYFDESITVDAIHRFKPDLEAYRYSAAHLDVQAGEIQLIAAHAWDVFGAMKAGWRAAFVARNGIPLFPLSPKPEIIGPDMKAVTDAILS
jgi:2-haloacid dehalogenase